MSMPHLTGPGQDLADRLVKDRNGTAPDVVGTLADHEARISALEGSPPPVEIHDSDNGEGNSGETT